MCQASPSAFCQSLDFLIVSLDALHNPAEDVDDLTKGMESAVLYTDARAKAEEMAQAAKAEGKSVEEQVTAASEGAIDSMKGANAKVVDEVNAAYKAAQETGISGGMTQPAAEIAAKNAVVNQLQKNGMSNQEDRARGAKDVWARVINLWYLPDTRRFVEKSKVCDSSQTGLVGGRVTLRPVFVYG